ncbi:YitT family protein [Pigmentiphaga aceris]|uniref:YitT family protein n=1 Tax=Pigmentiphaga aceris TaxID=1940612 RepID=A0A5C0AUZ3_9BURK|nr:YitT family protein [Pigmentiphaga aceris]
MTRYRKLPLTSSASAAAPLQAGRRAPSISHSRREDLFAIVIGTLFVSFGITLYGQAGLVTGSTAGMAFLLHYATGLPFGVGFFLINLPFYAFAVIRMGWNFALRTFCSVALVSAFSLVHPKFVQFNGAEPFYTAIFGGLLIGTGSIVLFRHRASLGGVNIVALYVQDKFGFPAGKLQMCVDICVVFAALFVVSPMAILASIIGAVALNLVIAMNHKPGRYMGI